MIVETHTDGNQAMVTAIDLMEVIPGENDENDDHNIALPGLGRTTGLSRHPAILHRTQVPLTRLHMNALVTTSTMNKMLDTHPHTKQLRTQPNQAITILPMTERRMGAVKAAVDTGLNLMMKYFPDHRGQRHHTPSALLTPIAPLQTVPLHRQPMTA